MRDLFRTLPLMVGVLAIPVIPFLFFGERLEGWLRGMAAAPPSATATFLLIVGLLATDILLPIPSSVISTLSGWQLGWWLGTLATWIGMTLGAVIGFGLARRYGSRFALWFSRGDDLDRMRMVSDRYGPSALVLTRAVPVFAEATVLLAGIHRLSWRRFLPAVMLSNAGIAIAYSALGDVAERYQWLPLALGVAIALPLAIAGAARRFFW